MQIKTLSKPLNFLVELLSNAIKIDGKLSPRRVKELVLTANIQEEDLIPYADFDHPIEDCYGRQMVYDNGDFEVMAMSWMPGDYSSIHNHGYTQWGVVQVFGNTHHFIYNIKNDVLNFSKKEILTKGSVVKVNNNLIHQMGNPTTEQYLSLHVYGSNDRKEEVTSDAKNFDLEFNRVSHTTGGAFFNLPEDVIYDFEKSPHPSKEVFLHYAHLLISYYNRQPYSERIEKLKRNILSKIGRTILNRQKSKVKLEDYA